MEKFDIIEHAKETLKSANCLDDLMHDVHHFNRDINDISVGEIEKISLYSACWIYKRLEQEAMQYAWYDKDVQSKDDLLHSLFPETKKDY